MVTAKQSPAKYIKLKEAYNQISSEGCKYLCEANWKELSSLVLSIPTLLLRL